MKPSAKLELQLFEVGNAILDLTADEDFTWFPSRNSRYVCPRRLPLTQLLKDHAWARESLATISPDQAKRLGKEGLKLRSLLADFGKTTEQIIGTFTPQHYKLEELLGPIVLLLDKLRYEAVSLSYSAAPAVQTDPAAQQAKAGIHGDVPLHEAVSWILEFLRSTEAELNEFPCKDLAIAGYLKQQLFGYMVELELLKLEFELTRAV